MQGTPEDLLRRKEETLKTASELLGTEDHRRILIDFIR
jgi:hypothetical protein